MWIWKRVWINNRKRRMIPGKTIVPSPFGGHMTYMGKGHTSLKNRAKNLLGK